MDLPEKFIAIDEEGYPLFGDIRVTDPMVGEEIYQNLKFADNGALISSAGGENVIVEAFDEALVARHFYFQGSRAVVAMPFEVEFSIQLKSLRVDEWDRFHGLTESGIPFVLSRNAQAEFFQACDDYDDESVTLHGVHIPVEPLLISDPSIEQSSYWSQVYQTETPRWELNQASPILLDMLPRLKLPKSRVLVLGCGSGNDAAYFAEMGHVVTAVDFSADALSAAQKKYSSFQNITWLQADVFDLPADFHNSFDLIFEHTCFCAVAPHRRNDLIHIWRRCLVEGGHLLAVLFAMEKKNGPPFGGSEWEYRERLKKHFHFLFWARWKQSIDRRNGKELFIYAKKRS